jgi:hypothetical protein
MLYLKVGAKESTTGGTFLSPSTAKKSSCSELFDIGIEYVTLRTYYMGSQG